MVKPLYGNNFLQALKEMGDTFITSIFSNETFKNLIVFRTKK